MNEPSEDALAMALRMHDVQHDRANRIEAERDQAIAEADRQRARADSNGHARDVARAELDRVRALAMRWRVVSDQSMSQEVREWCGAASNSLTAILDSCVGDAAQRRSEEEGREGVDRADEPPGAVSEGLVTFCLVSSPWFKRDDVPTSQMCGLPGGHDGHHREADLVWRDGRRWA